MKYDVVVNKIEYYNEVVTVDAKNKHDAVAKALAQGDELDFNYLDCEYSAEVDDVEVFKEYK